mmetsp:Transcript_12207/g.24087  ORF Transcript_12207/g.24087 Transcript_12207/m.24087 type:complete len:136 (-) Transcript_12207:85-492(-)
MHSEGVFGAAKLVGVVKEVAPGPSAKTDEKLGIAVMQNKFFKNPIYYDHKRVMMRHIGVRLTCCELLGAIWNCRAQMKRNKAKNVEQNFAGEGAWKGGVLMVAKGGTHVEFVADPVLGEEVDWAEVRERWKNIQS